MGQYEEYCDEMDCDDPSYMMVTEGDGPSASANVSTKDQVQTILTVTITIPLLKVGFRQGQNDLKRMRNAKSMLTEFRLKT
ncbi:hypothetical protein DPMN_013133 [Dreissena polymorpha]|uniref:Uncharacterized protein n=1 Tax=Dreissena polymorpha TaxID=45954 RepID=A0A9D4N8D3_DREPO|nr:hypothetical protein DPMN_013133 [Dreissena polymorpha]